MCRRILRSHFLGSRCVHPYVSRLFGLVGEDDPRAAAAGRDVYAYFNNDIDGAAVANARTLIEYLRT